MGFRHAKLAALASSLFAAHGQAQVDILSFVDPLIGTTNGGHVFPGATLPFGMAKAGADVNVENQGGFSTGDVTGNITVRMFQLSTMLRALTIERRDSHTCTIRAQEE